MTQAIMTNGIAAAKCQSGMRTPIASAVCARHQDLNSKARYGKRHQLASQARAQQTRMFQATKGPQDPVLGGDRSGIQRDCLPVDQPDRRTENNHGNHGHGSRTYCPHHSSAPINPCGSRRNSQEANDQHVKRLLEERAARPAAESPSMKIRS